MIKDIISTFNKIIYNWKFGLAFGLLNTFLTVFCAIYGLWFFVIIFICLGLYAFYNCILDFQNSKSDELLEEVPLDQEKKVDN